MPFSCSRIRMKPIICKKILFPRITAIREILFQTGAYMISIEHEKKKAIEMAEHLSQRIEKNPEICILIGTGLARSVASLGITESFDYESLPYFPVSTVQSHSGKLLFGEIGEKTVAVMLGRFHLYEGYSPLQVTFPIRVMQELGVKVLILSNAAGGFNPAFEPGDVMVITDHINLTGENPLVGPNEDSWGIRFPDMGWAYDRELSALAAGAGLRLQKGVYAGLKGPSLETPAEVRFLRLIGADAVGFSTVLEVIAGVHAGMRILGLSTITNVHNPDDPSPATLEDIIDIADGASPVLDTIFRYVAEHLP